MILRAWFVALLMAGGVVGAQAPVTVRLVDPGDGVGPLLLSQVLAGPYRVIGPAATQALLPRDSVYRQTVLVLGRDAVLDGRVEGDLVVVGGDLHLHPRAVVTGRAVAIGGGVYESSMARAESATAFRDFTYDIAPIAGGYALRYRSLINRPASQLSLPGLYGLRIPTYDRSNGLSLVAGPAFAPGTKWLIEPTVAYRSGLGVWDPALLARVDVDSRTTLRVIAERGTFSNEDWIWSDLLNSVATLASGNDARNHFRASRATMSAAHRWIWTGFEIEPYVGARTERAESVRPDSDATGGPWSFRGRRDHDDMLRPNPLIDDGTILSGLVGVRMSWSRQGLRGRLGVDVESGTFEPRTDTSTSPHVGQTTIDGVISFPTFGTQSVRVEAHAVVSFTSNTPRQRWAYVGGSGSLSTLEMLERGGNQLVYFDARYNIPLTRIVLPLVGSPVLSIREVLAGADVDHFPAIAQAVGLRLAVSAVYIQFLVDPARRHGRFSGGLSLAR